VEKIGEEVDDLPLSEEAKNAMMALMLGDSIKVTSTRIQFRGPARHYQQQGLI